VTQNAKRSVSLEDDDTSMFSYTQKSASPLTAAAGNFWVDEIFEV
jgi:hypothetical protein